MEFPALKMQPKSDDKTNHIWYENRWRSKNAKRRIVQSRLIFGWDIYKIKKTVINCVCKGHRDKIKIPDPVVKDLISKTIVEQII